MLVGWSSRSHSWILTPDPESRTLITDDAKASMKLTIDSGYHQHDKETGGEDLST